MTIFGDLAAEQDRLENILAGLDETRWMSASGAAGWTVADVVLHLAQSEEAVSATVTRVVRGRRKGDAGSAVGLRFESLSAVAHLILRGYLRSLPRPVARREPPSALQVKGDDYAGIVRGILEGRST